MNVTTPLLSYLQNPEKITPMLLIEVPTSSGRIYQGYKRGGKVEARERACEETLGAAVWLFGMKAFNKGFDFVGKNLLNLKDLDIDVGKDSLRNPASYIDHKPTLTAAFKFSKITASALLSIAAMGYVVPKIKQAMTNAFRMKEGKEPIPDKNSPDGKFHKGWADKFVSNFIKYDDNAPVSKAEQKNNTSIIPSMDTFIQNAKQNNSPSFTGGSILNTLCFASHNLENNTVWRLLSTDVGTLSGRVATSRTKKEAIEYGVRDSISSVFYVGAAPAFSAILRKAFKIPNIDPKGAEATAKRMQDVIQKQGGKVKAGFFTSKILTPNKAEELVKDIKFRDDGTIWLDDFNRQTKNAWMGHAQAMSELQPKLLDENGIRRSILSKKQAIDVLSDSYLAEPVYLKEAISKATNGKSEDPRAFISRKKLEKIRDSFDDFAISLENYAKKKGKEIDSNLIDSYTKKLNRTNLAVHMAGIGFAVLGLAVLIPKFQYWFSEKITGVKGFSVDTNSNETNKTN